MPITMLELVLQRPATEEETDQLRMLEQLFDSMSVEERRTNKIHRVTDLAPEDSPLRDAVRYRGRRTTPIYINERFQERGRIPLGHPRSREILVRVVAGMLARYSRPEHECYYVVAEITDAAGRSQGFRTVVPRTEIPLRDVRHRDAEY